MGKLKKKKRGKETTTEKAVVRERMSYTKEKKR